jgi:hypothetical protein
MAMHLQRQPTLYQIGGVERSGGVKHMLPSASVQRMATGRAESCEAAPMLACNSKLSDYLIHADTLISTFSRPKMREMFLAIGAFVVILYVLDLLLAHGHYFFVVLNFLGG